MSKKASIFCLEYDDPKVDQMTSVCYEESAVVSGLPRSWGGQAGAPLVVGP